MPLEIRNDVPLAPLTTLGVGGSARFFATAKNAADVEAAAEFARSRDLPLFVLGGGSNVVISDRGWDGLVLQIGLGGLQRSEHDGKIVFQVGAGVDWDEFVDKAVSESCAGIECLSGIPGSLGGTPVQNVGAYGQEVSQSIVDVETYDLHENRVSTLRAAECGFSYRSSIFNGSARDRYVILRVSFALAPHAPASVLYADLQRYFSGSGVQPTVKQVREAVLSVRAAKGMVISPGDPDSRSAGSFFKNPLLSSEQFGSLQRRARERGLRIPNYPALSEGHKISAAWLVETSGFRKGYVKGNAGISSKHALAIVNRGGAHASDILALMEEIQTQVWRNWGVSLEPEPVFIG